MEFVEWLMDEEVDCGGSKENPICLSDDEMEIIVVEEDEEVEEEVEEIAISE